MGQIIRWQPIPGVAGYEASDSGQIRHTSGRFLGQGRNSSGHMTVSVVIDGKPCKRYVHRLVLAAFEGEPEPGMFACHFDDDPANNRLENLRWDTPKGNQQDSIRNARIGRLKVRPVEIHASWDRDRQAAAERHNAILERVRELTLERSLLIAELDALASQLVDK